MATNNVIDTLDSMEDAGGIVDSALIGLMKDALRAWRKELENGADYDTMIVTGGGSRRSFRHFYP